MRHLLALIVSTPLILSGCQSNNTNTANPYRQIAADLAPYLQATPEPSVVDIQSIENKAGNPALFQKAYRDALALDRLNFERAYRLSEKDKTAIRIYLQELLSQ